MGALFSTPKTRYITPPPAPAPEPTPDETGAMEEARRKARRRARGRASTILTGGQGVTGPALTRGKKLLGA